MVINTMEIGRKTQRMGKVSYNFIDRKIGVRKR